VVVLALTPLQPPQAASEQLACKGKESQLGY
jgi:hypothetical protein